MKGLVMSNKEYRQKEGISASDLKKMVKSMKSWKYSNDNPDEEDTPALKFGRAYHKYCLEPYDFYNEYIVSPKFDRRTKEGKQAYDKFLIEAEDKEVIDEEMFNTIDEMREELYKTPYVKKLLFGEHEQSFFWTDDATGIPLKCRPDSYTKLGNVNVIIDLKTVSNADTDAFMRDSQKYLYNLQAYHYIDGMKVVTGEDYNFVFIAQEKQKPYLVNVLEADEYFLQDGKEVRDEMLRKYKKCLELDEYPGLMGFEEDRVFVNTLTVPTWIRNAIDSESYESEE